ncbi:MAG: hypothetical protein K0M50_02870 [Prolixibacteraceae bacterium]|nr:hypothetical protein [Prolixibacteraceae bacterium]
MKKFFLGVLLNAFFISVYGQAVIQINDPYFNAQEDRMVITQWGNFLPKPRYFLGVQTNVHYMATWGWLAPEYSRDYRNGPDIRPLGFFGQQTQRMILNSSLVSVNKIHREITDSIAKTAQSEIINNSGLLSSADPLWLLYYKRELKGVKDYDLDNTKSDLSNSQLQRLSETGVLDWYDNEMTRMKERLEGAFNSDMERSNRIMAYHRIMMEYRKVKSKWNNSLVSASKSFSFNETYNKTKKITSIGENLKGWDNSSDRQIMNTILLNEKNKRK